MSQKRKGVEVPISVNFATSDQQKKWYLDIWGLQGSRFQKVRLFVDSDEDTNTFEDLGPVSSSCISVVDTHPDIECINIGIGSNYEYQLNPRAFVIERIARDKEETMFSRGWKLDCIMQEITAEELQDSIAYCLKGKQIKEKRPEKKTKSSTGLIDVDEAIIKSKIESTSTGTTSKIRFVDPKELENVAQKALRSDKGGMENYSKYFVFKYKEYEIPVEQCWLAPDHFNSRQLEPSRLEQCMKWFAKSATRPAAAAYLTPVRNAGKKKGIPLKQSEVVEEKLLEYSYWILDGQHSIYAAKYLRYQEMEKDGHSQELVKVYEKRKARIVVDPEPHIATAISAIANDEAQALYVKQPFDDILQHLRSQWIFNESPSRPAPGVTEGSTSRTNWDGFIRMAKITTGASFLSKLAHMVIYSDEVFTGWLEIMKEHAKKKKTPGATIFRCLAGLDEEKVKLIQSEIRSGDIVLSKGAKDAGLIDMQERIMQLKQDKIIQDALLKEFNTLNKDNQCKNWTELTTTYNINDVVYSVLLKLCDAWIKSKLQVGSKKIKFPIEATKYVELNINLSKERSTLALDLPWCVYVVSLPIERSYYLQRHFSNPTPIGLGILDNTEGEEGNMQWDIEKFSDLLNGIMAIAGGSMPSQYVFLAFLDNTDYIRLQCALQNMSGIVKRQFVGALHFIQSSTFVGAIQFFTVMIFLSKGEVFEGLADILTPGTQATVLDCALLDFDIDQCKTQPDIVFLRIKKRLIIKQCIQKFCIEGCKLVDLFSNGYITEVGLELKKEVICLVESIEDQRQLGTRLLGYKKSNDEIGESPGLHQDQQVDKPGTQTTPRHGEVRSAQDFLDLEDNM